MCLKKIKVEVECKVPVWEFCNHQGSISGQPTKERCRFCIKEKGYYRCALYNRVLDTSQGTLISKTRECQKAVAGFHTRSVENSTPDIDPKVVMKATITEYNKLRKQLLNQGYPSVLAEKLATEHLLGGN